MGIAYLTLAPELLREWLHLPDGTEIIASANTLDGSTSVRLLVDSPLIQSDAIEVAASYYKNSDGVAFGGFTTTKASAPKCASCGK